MPTETPDVRTVDAGPLDSNALRVAAGYLARAAVHMGAAEASTLPPGDRDAVRFHFEVSKRLARHAIAIVLGEKSADAQP